MNKQIQTIIDRARALLAAAGSKWDDVAVAGTPSGYWAVANARGDYETAHADAALIAAAPGLLATLCDALNAAQAREANALTACLCGRRGQCVWCRVEDHRLCAEAAELRAEEAEAAAAAMRLRVQEIAGDFNPGHERENGQALAEMREALEDVAASHPAGRALLDRLHAAEAERDALRERAGIAEGREAAAKANAEEVAGWLDARNAGLVQMARERDVLREKLAAAEANAARLEARTAGLCDCMAIPFAENKGASDCPECKGEGAVIVEGAAQEGGAE